MRPRSIVVIVLAVAVTAGLVLSGGRSDQVQLVQQSSEAADQVAPARNEAIAEVIARQDRALEQKAAEEERALTSDERALARKIAQDERAMAAKAAREEAALRRNGAASQQGPAAMTAQPASMTTDPQLSRGDTARVQTDPVPPSGDDTATSDRNASGAPAEGPATDVPIVSGGNDTATGTAEEADATGTAPTATPEASGDATEGRREAAGDDQPEADTPGRTTDMAELERLLTLETFDHDAVVTLIEDADELSLGKRLALRALVEGATAASAMAENAIGSIRMALDLPPLD